MIPEFVICMGISFGLPVFVIIASLLIRGPGPDPK